MIRTLVCSLGINLLALGIAAEPRPAQPFEAVSYDGRSVSLDSLKGKPSVLMFFSTDCPHCQRAANAIDPLYQSLRRAGFQMIGLSLNQTTNAGLRDFAARFNATFPLALSSRTEFSRISGVSVMTRISYPYILFLDKNGIIREERQGSEEAWFDNVSANFLKAVEPLLE